jgi:hypothetical protein
MTAWPPIWFYLPPPFWLESLPADADQSWPGFGLGLYTWTVQTYLRLRAVGVPCQLTPEFPDAGIVLAHRNLLNGQRPGPQTLLICLKGDLLPYAYAQLQVVQNPLEARAGFSQFIPHWPQPGLLERDRSRAAQLRTVAFLGHQANLAPPLAEPAWAEALAELGLVWQPQLATNRWHSLAGLPPAWHDYRHIDVVVAARRFGSARRYRSKPATKLYNAWLAGVPALLGAESAFQAERRSPLDYCEVTSATGAIAALQRLQQQPALYQAMVENGRQRAAAIAPVAITQRWTEFLQDQALPAYQRWCRTAPWQQAVILEQRRWGALRARSLRKVNTLWP